MAVNWPINLPQRPATYSEQKQPVTIHSQPDSGPRKSRRRFTRAVVKGQMEFLVTNAQAVQIDNFWTNNMDSGAEEVRMWHPWRDVQVNMRIPDAPQMAADGPLNVRVSFGVEFLAV